MCLEVTHMGCVCDELASGPWTPRWGLVCAGGRGFDNLGADAGAETAKDHGMLSAVRSPGCRCVGAPLTALVALSLKLRKCARNCARCHVCHVQ